MRILRRAARWTPSSRIYYGWIVLAVGAMGTYAATGSAQVTLAGIQTLMFEDTGWDRSTIAMGVSIGTWSAGLLTPVFGKIADTHGPRIVMPVAALITGICFFWIGGMSSVWHFYAAYIISRGFGNPALIGVVPKTVAVNFFQKRRNFVLGLVSMARPCFGAINVQLITLIAVWASWRTAYRILGSYSILLSIPLLIFMRRKPEDIGLLPDGAASSSPSKSERSGRSYSSSLQMPLEKSWTAPEAIRTSALWLVIAAEFLIILTSGTLGFQLVPYLKDSGISLTAAAAAWSLSSLLNAFSNPIWGFLSDSYPPRRLVLIALPVCLLVTSIFLIINGGWAGFFCVICWGASSGGLNVLGGMIIASYYGKDSFGTISGIMGPFQTFGLGIGPTLGALLFNATGGYRSLFIFALTSYLGATLLFILARKPISPLKKQEF